MLKKIVTIGGGTGSYTVLSALKNIPNIEINSIVAMTDDGGSTGVLKDELGVLPPGDVRQCMIALSDESQELRDLLNYRFEEGGLKGHNFGNIMLAALEKVTGDFTKAIESAEHILKIKGHIIPVVKEKARLIIMLDNKTLVGENEINHADISQSNKKVIKIENNIRLNNEARIVIEEADYIFIGPGNQYCSVLPALAPTGIKLAFKRSKAKIIYVANLTNKKGHNLHFALSQYVNEIEKYLDKKINYILTNNETPDLKQIKYYSLHEGDGVMVIDDMHKDKRVIREKLLSSKINKAHKSDKISNTRSFIRHDINKLTHAIYRIIFLS